MPKLKRSAKQHLVKINIGAFVLLTMLAYATTLQTHIAGSFAEGRSEELLLKNEYIKDVGEIQVALNTWGTVHHTGYPLFAMLGNLFTSVLRMFQVEPAAAASLYAMAWGLIALAGIGALLWRMTRKMGLVFMFVTVLALARSIWIHNVIAEVYSMSLAITVLMLVVALWPDPWVGRWSTRRRVWMLALLGGIGVAHHRAIVFVAPGLIWAVWPHVWAERHAWKQMVLPAMGLGLIGFLPYVYLPLREWQGGEWVYGAPGTWHGFWTEFSGREADRLVKLPADLNGWMENARDVVEILIAEISLPGLILGMAALVGVLICSSYRRTAQVLVLCAAGPTLFAVAYHTAVLPEAILMPTVLILVVGVALGVDALAKKHAGRATLVLLGTAIWFLVLWFSNGDYIQELVDEPTGLQTIERLEQLRAELPDDAQVAVMYPWGPRYFAASYSRLVTEENADWVIVDHKANYRKILADGYDLYTEHETFYTFRLPWETPYGAPSMWWNEHLGEVYLTARAPAFVQLQVAPPIEGPDTPDYPETTPIVDGIVRRGAWLTCDEDAIYLHVIWQADSIPSRNPSIFVHLTGDQPAPNPVNADSRYPVYGLYPFTEFEPGEIVRDDYTLPRLPDKTMVRLGLYEQDAGGAFTNYGELVLPVANCESR